MLKAIILAAGLSCLLTSCGGIHHYLHTDVPAPQGEELPPVALGVGESVKALKHSRGVAIAGGYVEGITIENPDIAVVRYGIDGNADQFDPIVRIVGLRPGTTRAAHGNRLGEAPDFDNPGFERPYIFLIHVTNSKPPFAMPTNKPLTTGTTPGRPSS